MRFVLKELLIAAEKNKLKQPSENTRWAREDEDVQLMLRLRDGDRDAFDEIVRRNTSKVHALVYHFLGDPAVVDDLTQEVFFRIYRTAGRYKPQAKFSTWLYRIVANLSFNVLRSRKKRRARQMDSDKNDQTDSFFSSIPDDRNEPPQHRLDAEEIREKIGYALDNLPENQKVAIILNKYEEKSYEEIAAVLDCSVMAVKSLLSRARANLRETLRRYL